MFKNGRLMSRAVGAGVAGLILIGGLLAPGVSAVAATTVQVTGTIVGESGPLGHVWVEAWRTKASSECGVANGHNLSCPFPISGVWTAADGTFSLTLGLYRWAFSVSPSSADYYYGRWYGGAYFPTYGPQPDLMMVDPEPGYPQHTSVFDLTSGTTTDLGTLQLARGGMFTGTVVPYKAGLVAQMHFWPSGQPGPAQNLDPDGKTYSADIVLPPGPVTVVAAAEGSTISNFISGTAPEIAVAGVTKTVSFTKAPARPATALSILGHFRVGQVAYVPKVSWSVPLSLITYQWAQSHAGTNNRYRSLPWDYGHRLQVEVVASAVDRWDYDHVLTSSTTVKTSLLRFAKWQVNSPGPDNASSNRSLNGEWIALHNFASSRRDLRGWMITPDPNQRGPHPRYTFTSHFYLAPGATVRIHTGRGTNTRTDRYWDLRQFVWPNSQANQAEADLLAPARWLQDACLATSGFVDCSGPSAP